MALTVTLSDSLSERLKEQAARSHVPVDVLAEELINNALLASDSHRHNDLERQDSIALANAKINGSLAEAIARAKGVPPSANTIERATKSVDTLLEELRTSPIAPDLLTFEELWPLWEAFEQEMDALDQAADHPLED